MENKIEQKEFKLLDKECNLIYEGIMKEDRLNREDIQVDLHKYYEIISEVEYIVLDDDILYLFNDYLDNTMTSEEKSIRVANKIFSSVEESIVKGRKSKIHYCAGVDTDTWDYYEYIREHMDVE